LMKERGEQKGLGLGLNVLFWKEVLGPDTSWPGICAKKTEMYICMYGRLDCVCRQRSTVYACASMF
jgi:hypothetical protein